jgi:sec-independent protein translocase protein TatB
VFGFSFGELVVLMIVAVVVIGPKDLPKVLRRAGQWAGKLRRMASDIRAQSGIDEVLRGEGIADDIAEIRKLARGEMEHVTRAARLDTALPARSDPYVPPAHAREEVIVPRDREYPREGADSYKALPDTALVYARTLPPSPFARDALYVMGDATAALPPEAPAVVLQPEVPPPEAAVVPPEAPVAEEPALPAPSEQPLHDDA